MDASLLLHPPLQPDLRALSAGSTPGTLSGCGQAGVGRDLGSASWHKAKVLHRWYYCYNQRAKREGLIRLLIDCLPSCSPWLNPIEPVFGQAKRHVVGGSAVPKLRELKCKTERYSRQRDKRLQRKEANSDSKAWASLL